jgi:hypothetical protein
MSILDKSSLVMIPSGYKEDKLYSVKPRNGDGDFTFTRASTGTRVNSDGYIEEVPWNELIGSEDYVGGTYGWYKNNCTIIANDTTSPIGINNASRISFTTTYPSDFRNTTQNISSINTTSIYVKYIDAQYMQLNGSNDGDHYCNYDVLNGVVGNSGAQSSGSIEDVGNGWFRLIFKQEAGTLAGDVRFINTDSLTSAFNSNASTNGDFHIWGAQSVKGTSVKPYIKTTDRLDVPRLDYSGGATNPTLLLEPQRTNLVPYSEDFSQWSAIGSNQTLVNNTNPIDNNAYGIESSVTSSHSRIYLNALMTAGNDYSSTYLVKPSSNPPEYLGFACISNTQPDVLYDFANNQFVDFNIVGNAAKCESISMNNGWKLLKLPVHENVINTRFNIYQGSRVGNNLYGTTGQSYYIKFAQLEQGGFATSYIPTSGMSVTRVADVCEEAGDSTTFNDSEGVLFAEIAALADDLSSRVISLNDGSTSNRVIILYQTITSSIRVIVSSGGSIEFDSNTQNYDITNFNKIALKYKENDFALWINGTEVSTDISGLTPIGLNNLEFNNANGTSNFFGKCKQLIYFNEALTDDELEELTTI